jgi:hypothetical protein
LFSITPEPDPSEPVAALDAVISTAMLASWIAALIGLGTRRRFGLAATGAGGSLLAGAALLCAVTGHTGLWIAAQVGVGVTLAAAGRVAARIA